MAKKFPTMPNPYTTDTEQAQPQAQQENQEPQYYRFSLKLPPECGDYLREMAWRNRTTITDYLTRVVLADKEAHPEWRETFDILNKKDT